MFRVELEDQIIQCDGDLEATHVIAVGLYLSWKNEPSEGDGPSGWGDAKIQAYSMLCQSRENGLNLEADGVAVQYVG